MLVLLIEAIILFNETLLLTDLVFKFVEADRQVQVLQWFYKEPVNGGCDEASDRVKTAHICKVLDEIVDDSTESISFT